MAQSTDGGDGSKTPAGPQPPAVQVRVAGQYIKDLSFENPNVRKLLDGPGEKPALRVEVNVNATKLNDKMFESAILFKAEAASNAGVIYDLELARTFRTKPSSHFCSSTVPRCCFRFCGASLPI